MSSLFSRDPRILVVCHGNINRSPLCAAILRLRGLTQVKEAALKLNGGGERAAKKMRDAALELGVNLESHRSTPITYGLLEWAEVVVYMDGGNLKRLQMLSPEPLPNQIWVPLGQYAVNPVNRVPDPAFIRRATPEFDAVVRLIQDATWRLADTIKQGVLA